MLGEIGAYSAAFGTALVAAVLALAGCGGGDGGPSVSIASPEDGATVPSPVMVEMSADGLDVEAAGAVREGAGHFHLLIDLPCDEPGEVAAAGPQRLSLDDGSSRADVPLGPGDHRLCLQAADGSHAALAATDEITIHVQGVVDAKPPPPDTSTTAAAGGARWKGTSRGDVKPGPDCDAATNTGEFTVVVGSDNGVTGSGSVTSSAYTCQSPQGTAHIPEMTAQYTLTGRKEPTYFLLTFSNGLANMKVPYSGARGYTSYDMSVGEYIARGTITMHCVDC